MANREKIRLMTDIAVYRKNHERFFQANKYFGYDYIVWHMLLGAVRYTICAVLFGALFVVFDAEVFFYNVNLEGIRSTLVSFSKYYLAGLAVYSLISLMVYLARYRKARKGMLHYASMLRKLMRYQ